AELIQKSGELKALRDKLFNERGNMNDEQARLRDNISVLGKDTQSVSLKERYVKKLSDQENRFESISGDLNKLDKEITELNKEIDGRINGLKI
ncbi:MAG: hypothetical protein KGD66_06965, partial [Candidatus Lokiarchaeota archaeon]|nr:hypothetical protein [Candidatus Lokiarchaeota archaeon]